MLISKFEEKDSWRGLIHPLTLEQFGITMAAS